MLATYRLLLLAMAGGDAQCSLTPGDIGLAIALAKYCRHSFGTAAGRRAETLVRCRELYTISACRAVRTPTHVRRGHGR